MMANIPIRDITLTGVPSASSNIVFDDGQMKKGLVSDLADGVRPVASQSEAQAGSDNTKTMTPLRVKDSISSEVGVSLASKAQGDLANAALQPDDIGASVQGYDADLAAIAALSPTDNDVLQRKSGAWTNRTPTQLKSDLSLNNVDNTSDASKPVSTATQTALNLKANTADLADVATSGSYTDLTDKPTIPAAGLPTGGTTGQVLAKTSGTDYAADWQSLAGTGDVVGPASAVDGDVALFDSTTGKLIKSGGAYNLTQTGTGAVPVAPYIGIQGRVFTPEQFGAKGDTRIITGTLTVTAGGTTLTFAAAHGLTSADAGKIIAIGEAGYSLAVDGSVDTAGSGYTNGVPTLTLTGGTKVTAATAFVGVVGGVVTSFNQMTDPGKYSVVPSNPISTTSSDSGTGAKLNINWRKVPHVTTIASVPSTTTIELTDGAIQALSTSSQQVYYGTDDTLAIQAAISAWEAALLTQRSAQLLFPRDYTITSQLVLQPPLNGGAPYVEGYNSLILAALSTDSLTAMYVVGGGEPSAGLTGIGVNASRGAKRVTMLTAGAIRKGDCFWIDSETNVSTHRIMSNKALEVNGADVTLEVPLEFDIDHIQPNSVQRWESLKNLTVKGLIFDGFATTAQATVGMHCFQLEDANIQVKARNFWNKNSTAWAIYDGYNCQIDVEALNGAGGDGSDALILSYVTGGRARVRQVNSYGFGMGINGCTTRLELESYGSKGRDVKFASSCGCTGFLHADIGEDASWVGVAFTQGSSDNHFDYIKARGHFEAVWSDGTGNFRNTIGHLDAAGSSNSVALAAGDDDWTVKLAPGTDSVPILLGAGIKPRIIPSKVPVVKATVSADKTIAANGFTVLQWDTEVVDPFGEYDPTTYTLTVKIPGKRQIKGNARLNLSAGSNFLVVLKNGSQFWNIETPIMSGVDQIFDCETDYLYPGDTIQVEVFNAAPSTAGTFTKGFSTLRIELVP